MLRVVGVDVPLEAWEPAFARGAQKVRGGTDLDQMVPLFDDRGKQLVERLPELTAEDLARKSGRTLPDGADDLRGFVSFLLWHEAFHLGQIDLIRAGLGLGGVP